VEEKTQNVKVTDHNAAKIYSSRTVSHYSLHWKLLIKVDVTNSGQLKFRQKEGKVVPVHVIKAYDGMEVQFHSFLSSAVDRSEWSVSCLATLPRQKEPVVPTAQKA
jgi:uncharacterized membrane protein